MWPCGKACNLSVHAIAFWKSLWRQLTASLNSAIKVWNMKCERLNAADGKIIFFREPAPTLVETEKKGRRDEVELDVEFHSVFAETFARTFLGHPKKRVYIWMTRSAPVRILYNYGGVRSLMPTHLVNLDALIRREDFESSETLPSVALGDETPSFKLSELTTADLYYKVLRKPDFWRETNNWSPERIVEFVRSFLDREVIPAIILWQSKKTNKVFVIDGAHRVSALIAWVNNDYGNGKISQEFYGYKVPAAQATFHKKTETLVQDTIGSYAELFWMASNEDKAPDEHKLRRGRVIGLRRMPVQIVDGDASSAESSFYRINSSPTTIDPIELDVIRSRRKPNVVATRAIIGAGTGHKYWGKFQENSEEVESLALDAYTLTFGQILLLLTQSADLPRAGQPYSKEGFRMVLDMVNRFNNISPAMWQVRDESSPKNKRPKQAVTPLADDEDGSKTIEFLSKVKKLGRLVSDNSLSGSLGLDHAVYSYGSTGRFHPAAFIASHEFARRIESSSDFTTVRKDAEEFLVGHKSFINRLVHSQGSGTRALEPILALFERVVEAFLNGRTADQQIIEFLRTDPKLKKLEEPDPEDVSSNEEGKRVKFSATVQRAAVVREILETRLKCNLCGARIPPFARSKDHDNDIKNGGDGALVNLRFTHPYCNSGYKNKLQSLAAQAEKPPEQ